MKTIAIIGGGFSGTLTAILLLQKSKAVKIKLINSGLPIAKGIAYSSISPEHLLNVPAGRMSAFSNIPDHFTNWLKTNNYKSPEIGASFLPRFIYGKYITELFDSIKSNERFELIDSKATDVVKQADGYSVQLQNGNSVVADKIVLALGNFLPANPPINRITFFESKNYFQNPWAPAYLTNIDLKKDILLMGTGLTMVDCVLSLKKAGFAGKIIVASPRGYTPASHGKTDAYPDFYSELKGLSLAEMFHIIRKHLKNAESKNISWRGVVDSLRPHVQEIWVNFSKKEKKQFISHVRHIWGIARHRLPMDTHKELFDLKNSGKLEIIGGRIIDMQENEGCVSAIIRLRKSSEQKTLKVSRVINCTGPQTNYKDLQDELVMNLLSKEMILADELKMGIQTTLKGHVLKQNDQPSSDIYAIGSLLRGVLWETTAVPEICVQAESIAQQIIKNLGYAYAI